MIFSVKAVLNSTDLFETMIELSPQALRGFASASSADGQTQEYSLTGPRLLEVARSQFVENFGNRDRDHFAFTKGLVTYLLKRYTTRSEAKALNAVVWTTHPDVDEEHLVDFMPEAERPAAEVLRGPEWCGFGDIGGGPAKSDTQLCWYRFAVMTPLTGIVGR